MLGAASDKKRYAWSYLRKMLCLELRVIKSYACSSVSKKNDATRDETQK